MIDPAEGIWIGVWAYVAIRVGAMIYFDWPEVKRTSDRIKELHGWEKHR